MLIVVALLLYLLSSLWILTSFVDWYSEFGDMHIYTCMYCRLQCFIVYHLGICGSVGMYVIVVMLVSTICFLLHDSIMNGGFYTKFTLSRTWACFPCLYICLFFSNSDQMRFLPLSFLPCSFRNVFVNVLDNFVLSDSYSRYITHM